MATTKVDHKALVVELDGGETEELRHILLAQLPAFLELFIRKNAEYGDNAQHLGAKGQFADIWRKIGKLKTGLWEGQEERLTSESVDEILRDLIGHCLLTLTIRAREREAHAEANYVDANAPFPPIIVGDFVFWNSQAHGWGLKVVDIDPSRENGRTLRVRNKDGEEGWIDPAEVRRK